ncbi:hypothetical protein [Fructilactobacillus frigidiflavus]|uniref:hypothetical protein n=1 Tax=Fructilactobacillus frigidiflavus TaxID=3242688 RepID=UPI0037562E26
MFDRFEAKNIAEATEKFNNWLAKSETPIIVKHLNIRVTECNAVVSIEYGFVATDEMLYIP